MKTYESSPSFAVAKKSRVPLAKIEASDSAAALKLGRVFASTTGRSTQTATFNSAL
ncbi:FxSxx-COOH cyclophane-containing RiPP peptide [Streptomyces sp. C11-1]|uniref:FxSxx-COOH cyclophane-containing RiPP peptide n=1 Tax=Streptomyces durocortorensis TaxID=2811104 RepID=A0ABY9VR49_9ACTN|nr:FxSxx-COOH cyclophane-containing RiPP peptide [Streptomyces durocortorensis]WNF26248.1 FxSxx-COOH cyclophane-containing RiPP peptide [Streptomyces durocortorensis]